MDKRRYPRLSLDLLRGFRVAARHLSFTRAAQELLVTQSAISREIKTLEAAARGERGGRAAVRSAFRSRRDREPRHLQSVAGSATTGIERSRASTPAMSSAAKTSHSALRPIAPSAYLATANSFARLPGA